MGDSEPKDFLSNEGLGVRLQKKGHEEDAELLKNSICRKFSQDLRNPSTETIKECLWKGKLIVIEEIQKSPRALIQNNAQNW